MKKKRKTNNSSSFKNHAEKTYPAFKIASIGGGPRGVAFTRQVALQGAIVTNEFDQILENDASTRQYIANNPEVKKIFDAHKIKPADIKKIGLSQEDRRRIKLPLEIDVIEPGLPGAGAIWSPTLPKELYANTPDCQLQITADRTVTKAAPDDRGMPMDKWLETRFEKFLEEQLNKFIKIRCELHDHGHANDEIAPEIQEWLEKDFFQNTGQHIMNYGSEKREITLKQHALLWKTIQFERWFNGKSYGKKNEKCYKDGKIEINDNHYSPRFLHGLYLYDMMNDMIEHTSSDVKINIVKNKAYDITFENTDDRDRKNIRISLNGTTKASETEPSHSAIYNHALLATGHSVNTPDPGERKIQAFAENNGKVRWVRSHKMSEAIGDMTPDMTVGLRGQGLTAYDALALLTIGKGGKFKRDESTGKLLYLSSGNEPKKIYMGSTTGVPLSGKGKNAKGADIVYQPYFFTEARVDELRAEQYEKIVTEHNEQYAKKLGITPQNAQLDFFGDIPEIDYIALTPLEKVFPQKDKITGLRKLNGSLVSDLMRDMELEFYESTRGPEFADLYKQVGRNDEERQKLLLTVPPQERLDFDKLLSSINARRPEGAVEFDPAALVNTKTRKKKGKLAKTFDLVVNPEIERERRQFKNNKEYQEFMRGILREDLEDCANTNMYGLKAATDVLRDTRNIMRYAVNHGGITPESQEPFPLFLRWNALLSMGPPAFRVEELLALSEAGIVQFIGPNMIVEPDHESEKYALSSKVVGTESSSPISRFLKSLFNLLSQKTVANAPHKAEVDCIIDTYQAKTSIQTDKSTLMANLVRKGIVAPFINTNPLTGRNFVSGGVNIQEGTYLVIDKFGEVIPNFQTIGIPTEGAITFTNNAPRPNVNSTTLNEAATCAETALQNYRSDFNRKLIRVLCARNNLKLMTPSPANQNDQNTTSPMALNA